jgi:hypothetical protein
MPEISFFFFDLEQIFRLFPKEDKEFNQKIRDYEEQLEENMAQNRLRLFCE